MPAPGCRIWTYDNAKPSGSAVIVRGDRFLAVRRAQAPALGRWDLPGGFCDSREHPADAAVRETSEETGLNIHLGPLIGTYLGDYAWQGDTYTTLNAYYLASLADLGAEPQLSTETTDTAWLPLAAARGLAFEHQTAMITDAAQLLRAGRSGEIRRSSHPDGNPRSSLSGRPS